MTGPSRPSPPLAGGGRVAILGSCVTRDLWRMAGAPADELLYVSRTRLPSLFGARPEGLDLPGLPPGLRRNPAQALRADLSKTGLETLAAFRPDVVILDFIDERFDLKVGAGGTVATASWELETAGWDALPALRSLRRLDALGDADWTLWRRALDALATLFAPGGPLSGARPVLHEAAWAGALRTRAGRTEALEPDLEITPGRRAPRTAHNARLARMHAAARAAIPRLEAVRAPDSLILSDPDHVWGLSPFHYVADYYAEVWRRLGGR